MVQLQPSLFNVEKNELGEWRVLVDPNDPHPDKNKRGVRAHHIITALVLRFLKLLNISSGIHSVPDAKGNMHHLNQESYDNWCKRYGQTAATTYEEIVKQIDQITKGFLVAHASAKKEAGAEVSKKEEDKKSVVSPPTELPAPPKVKVSEKSEEAQPSKIVLGKDEIRVTEIEKLEMKSKPEEEGLPAAEKEAGKQEPVSLVAKAEVVTVLVDKPAAEIPLDDKALTTAKLTESTAVVTKTFPPLIKSIEKNPFCVAREFVPLLMEHLLPSEEKHRVEGIRKFVNALQPAVNHSPLIHQAVVTLKMVATLAGLSEEAEPKTFMQFFGKLIADFNALDIDAIAKSGKQGEIYKKLDEQKLGLVGFFCGDFVKNLAEAHKKMHLKKTATEQSTAVVQDPMLEFEFVTRTLPGKLEILKEIKFWQSPLSGILSIIPTGGRQFIIDKILKMDAFAKMRFLKYWDDQAKIAAVECLILAAPTLLKKHNLDTYSDFCNGLKNRLKNEKPINQDALFIVFLKIMQQFTRESALYGPILEKAINQASL